MDRKTGCPWNYRGGHLDSYSFGVILIRDTVRVERNTESARGAARNVHLNIKQTSEYAGTSRARVLVRFPDLRRYDTTVSALGTPKAINIYLIDARDSRQEFSA